MTEIEVDYNGIFLSGGLFYYDPEFITLSPFGCEQYFKSAKNMSPFTGIAVLRNVHSNKIVCTQQYKNGKKHGEYISFNHLGEITQKWIYKEGVNINVIGYDSEGNIKYQRSDDQIKSSLKKVEEEREAQNQKDREDKKTTPFHSFLLYLLMACVGALLLYLGYLQFLDPIPDPNMYMGRP